MENFYSKKLPTSNSEQKSIFISNSTNSLANITNISGKGSSNANKHDSRRALFNIQNSNKKRLKLNFANNKSPRQACKVLNDRFIPNRVTTDMEASYHLLNLNKNHATTAAASSDDVTSDRENQIDTTKKKLLADLCNGIQEKTKMLCLHNKRADQFEEPAIENMKYMYNTNNLLSSIKKKVYRTVPSSPERILDAPDFLNDYYLNLMDWSSTNFLAVALNKDAYIWNANNNEISNLFDMESESDDYISATAWIQTSDDVLAVGNSKNIVELWDVNTQVRLRQMKSQKSRVGSLSWNHHIVTSGSRSGTIHHHDVRVPDHHVGTLKLHEQEVCGLRWNNDGRYLASGANDNLVCIWDSRISHDSAQPLHVFNEHKAAVKALAWCPWQSNILATGGGTADGHIKIWNVYSGSLVRSHDAKSQISCLLWSKNYKEIISSHGYKLNQLSIWKYPEMTKVCDLNGHTNRVLMMAISPDEEMVASVASDETLRLWKCFAVDKKQKRTKEGLGEKSALYNSLNTLKNIR